MNYNDLIRIVLDDKKYSIVGDALLNAAATLHSIDKGKPKSVRVKNTVLANALRQVGLSDIHRRSKHKLADIYEAIVGYAYLNNLITLEDLRSIFVRFESERLDSDAFIATLNFLIGKIKEEGKI
jgi:hypothetical protein